MRSLLDLSPKVDLTSNVLFTALLLRVEIGIDWFLRIPTHSEGMQKIGGTIRSRIASLCGFPPFPPSHFVFLMCVAFAYVGTPPLWSCLQLHQSSFRSFPWLWKRCRTLINLPCTFLAQNMALLLYFQGVSANMRTEGEFRYLVGAYTQEALV